MARQAQLITSIAFSLLVRTTLLIEDSVRPCRPWQKKTELAVRAEVDRDSAEMMTDHRSVIVGEAHSCIILRYGLCCGKALSHHPNHRGRLSLTKGDDINLTPYRSCPLGLGRR